MDLPPPVPERSLTPFPQRPFDEDRTSWHGVRQSSAAPVIAQAISMGKGGWTSWTHPTAGQSTAHLGLAGALVFLEAELAE